ncbi:DUF3383 family protein [Desulfosporosinus fructosivorans]|uniref:DUF3383 family protein n=1 Tax=Desulfosporosinus fructosivorans TaxID=2018669 RepID=A0A4Z0R2J9_9FIRM|nr:DUF3383 family protein [Desulfosporosinus fructosivorans]TGE35876.1 DUF3383 family protein [Desulfosporosinus fructosivorans]
MSTLPLSDIVDISVVVSPVATIRSGFNLGLIVGSSTHITASDRVKLYTSADGMIADGFTVSEAEYKAADLYFRQIPKPSKVAIGRWDKTGSETALQAVAACRAKNTDWYACYLCGAVKADILAIAPYIEVVEPDSAFFYTTADADVLAGTAGNVMLTLKAAGYMRTIGQYSTYQDAAVSIMGYAMGANTGLANTAYTLAHKKEIGVIPEDMTPVQVTLMKEQNGNYYVNRGNTYNLFQQGIMANGMPFDEIINLDMLKNDIQIAVMDLLTGISKIPQNEGGVTLLISAITEPCESALNRGFLSPGVWNAASILNLNTGDTLSKGYLILTESIDSQSETDRTNRIAPPIYVCVKLAGAIEFVAIQINVNR